MSDTNLAGGCLCGAVRFRVRGQPARSSACHCTFCQKRTGAAFGLGAYFNDDAVEVLTGSRKTYEHRSDESGRWLRIEFCTNCGGTVTWTVEALPGMRAFAGGSFDDPQSFPVTRHAWLRSAHRWFKPPSGVETFEKGTLPPPKK
ncbi:MAG: GFA family protein [Burkholderiales bacterium]